MKFRNSIWPRRTSDYFTTSFVLFFLTASYFYDLFIVVPTVYEIGSSTYNIHFVIQTIMTISIYTNYFATVLCDTSIKGEMLQPANNNSNSRWRFCVPCEILSPPRSWHCKICNTCILKRDHHCIFTGCCIGHRNYRYFFMNTFYFAIASLYHTWFNHRFVWRTKHIMTMWNLFKMICPLALLALDPPIEQLYLLMYMVGFYSGCFNSFILIHQIRLIISGAVEFEDQHDLSYNMGLKKNVECALGERWYLTWISPFIASPLPQDGIHWNIKSVKHL